MWRAGLNPGLGGAAALIDTATRLLPGSRVRQTYRRKSSQPGRVLTWELAP